MLIHFSFTLPLFILIPTLILLGNSPNNSNSTLFLAQLGLVLFCVAKPTCKGLPTIAASENTIFFPKIFGGSDENEVHAIGIDFSLSDQTLDPTLEFLLDMINNMFNVKLKF